MRPGDVTVQGFQIAAYRVQLRSQPQQQLWNKTATKKALGHIAQGFINIKRRAAYSLFKETDQYRNTPTVLHIMGTGLGHRNLHHQLLGRGDIKVPNV